MAAINGEVAERFPGRIMIAEDLSLDASITRPGGRGRRRVRCPVGSRLRASGQGGPRRLQRRGSATSTRSLRPCSIDAADAFKRVIYTESHDEVANGQLAGARGDLAGLCRQLALAQASRARFGARAHRPPASRCSSRVRSSSRAPGSPTRSRSIGASGTVTLACFSSTGTSSACGATATTRPAGYGGPRSPCHHRSQDAKVLAFHRWEKGGPRDDVIVVANFSASDPGLVSDRRASQGPLARALQQRLGRL